jgi:hypothetical protein
MSSSSLWQPFQQYFLSYADLGFSIDISRMIRKSESRRAIKRLTKSFHSQNSG